MRKIVDHYFDEYDMEIEILECGHEVPLRYDLFGPARAARRRCWMCGLEETQNPE